MTVQELKDNTFGSLIDIQGHVANLILMLNNPARYEDLVNKSIGILDNGEPNSIITTEFRRGVLKINVSKESVFCISLANGIFVANSTIELLTRNVENALVPHVILAYPGMDGKEKALAFLKETFHVMVTDHIEDSIPYAGFQSASSAYLKELANQTRLSQE